MTPEQAREARHAAAKRRRADEEYRETLEELIASGVSYVDLGRVLGISRQAVRQYIEQGRKS